MLEFDSLLSYLENFVAVSCGTKSISDHDFEDVKRLELIAFRLRMLLTPESCGQTKEVVYNTACHKPKGHDGVHEAEIQTSWQ